MGLNVGTTGQRDRAVSHGRRFGSQFGRYGRPTGCAQTQRGRQPQRTPGGTAAPGDVSERNQPSGACAALARGTRLVAQELKYLVKSSGVMQLG